MDISPINESNKAVQTVMTVTDVGQLQVELSRLVEENRVLKLQIRSLTMTLTSQNLSGCTKPNCVCLHSQKAKTNCQHWRLKKHEQLLM